MTKEKAPPDTPTTSLILGRLSGRKRAKLAHATTVLKHVALNSRPARAPSAACQGG
ncbi:MAG: hypothetical protein V1809_11940 [Planctomycetota bacterium]